MTTSGQAGALIAGRYRLERPTGGGTWPEDIWQGFDETLSRPVMMRLLPVEEQVEADVEQQAHSVVAQVARLGHPNIAQVYDVGQERGMRYVVSEWTGGRTLGQIMATGRQRWQRAADWGQQIAEALAALHSVGLVDGVLGPETVSVLDDRRVKLTDVGLGIAQDADGAQAPAGSGRGAGFVSPDDEATRLVPPPSHHAAGAGAQGVAGGPDAEATRIQPPAGADEDATRLVQPGSGPGDQDATRFLPPTSGAGADEPTRLVAPYPGAGAGRPVPAGAASDVYALAAILWTAMVGTPPRVEPTDLAGPDTEPLRAIGAPEDLAGLLGSMLAASEQVRPTASVAANRFAALAIEGRERSDTLPTAVVAQPTQALGEPMRTRPATATGAAVREPQDTGGHGRAWALAIGLVLLLAAAAAALALWLNHNRNNPAPVVPPVTGVSTSGADTVSISPVPSTSSAAPATSSAPSSPSPSPSPTPSATSASPSASPSPSPSTTSASPSPSPTPSPTGSGLANATGAPVTPPTTAGAG